MENEPKKSHGMGGPLTLSERKTLWWTVCIATMVCFWIVFEFPTDSRGEFIPYLIFTPLTVPFLPFGLAYTLALPFQWMQDHYGDNHILGVACSVMGWLMLPLAFVIFWMHWKLTLKAVGMRPMLLLMLILILLTIGSMIGCSKVDFDFMPRPD